MLEQETAKHKGGSECPGRKPRVDTPSDPLSSAPGQSMWSISFCAGSLSKESQDTGFRNKPQPFQDGEVTASCSLNSTKRISFGSLPLFC